MYEDLVPGRCYHCRKDCDEVDNPEVIKSQLQHTLAARALGKAFIAAYAEQMHAQAIQREYEYNQTVVAQQALWAQWELQRAMQTFKDREQAKEPGKAVPGKAVPEQAGANSKGKKSF